MVHGSENHEVGVAVLTIIPNNLISEYLYPVTEILNFAGLEVSVSRGQYFNH